MDTNELNRFIRQLNADRESGDEETEASSELPSFIVDVFPADQQPQIRQQLSLALSAIIYQQLIPRKNGRGRVVACEILIANDAVRHHIRKGSLHQLHTEMTLGKKIGMTTLENSLAQLVRKDLITEAEARTRSTHLDELISLLKE